MANPTPPIATADLKRLKWRKDGAVLVATDGTCMYMREPAGSVVSGLIFGTALCLGLGGSGVMMLMQPGGADGKVFGGFVVLLGLFFGFLLVVTLRRGPGFPPVSSRVIDAVPVPNEPNIHVEKSPSETT